MINRWHQTYKSSHKIRSRQEILNFISNFYNSFHLTLTADIYVGLVTQSAEPQLLSLLFPLYFRFLFAALLLKIAQTLAFLLPALSLCLFLLLLHFELHVCPRGLWDGNRVHVLQNPTQIFVVTSPLTLTILWAACLPTWLVRWQSSSRPETFIKLCVKKLTIDNSQHFFLIKFSIQLEQNERVSATLKFLQPVRQKLHLLEPE